MGLKRYQTKRNFKRTPEPRGTPRTTKTGHSYVIQKHAARRLHYDFRLELNGVLVSWAVPKGPSLDPKEKRLAVHVEDHPVEYGGFEGIIPAGEYGGGTVLLWDRGGWTPDGDPVAGLRKGRLKFTLRGKKLRGGWTLVRMGGRAAEEQKENWLLIKENDAEAASLTERDILEERPESIATGRSMDEIKTARDREWTSREELKKNKSVPPRTKLQAKSTKREAKRSAVVKLDEVPGARRSELPQQIQPELATLVSQVPEGDDWLHEIKFDGYRALCRIEGGKAVFLTRRGQDWTSRFGHLSEAAASLPVRQALLDGEVVVLESDGTTNFQSLQNALGGRTNDRLVYFVFDLLHLDGYDTMQVPLLNRKEALAALLKSSKGNGSLRYSDHVLGNGKMLLRKACQLALEGVISKQANGAYRPGRGRDWLKTKCLQSQEFVIGGFTEPSGSREGLGSLLLGVHDEGGALIYAGRVGTGFTDESLRQLRAGLSALEQKSSPFPNPPRGAIPRRVHWVKPNLVAEVEFIGWTNDGRLRHPSFQGLREDKSAREVVREKAVPIPVSKKASSKKESSGDRVEIAGVNLTHPDRVLFPPDGITKRELALYYEEMADWILPHLAGRPLTLVRCPEGYDKECFYQKNATETLAKEIRRVSIREEKETKTYVAVDSLQGLISLVQMGVLELHTWGSHSDQVERPDRMIFDLDPDPSVEWEEVVRSAREVRALLIDLGFGPFLKTTGGKGLHVVVPLARKHDWMEVKEFSRAVAESFARQHPDRYTATASKLKRKGKIYIDYLRNGRGATAIAAYSTRARAGATVSVPLRWEELSPEIRSDQFTIRTLPRRMARLRRDPWDGYAAAGRTITAAMKKRIGVRK
jgi:bifunctional non-homologous end joining protein LigD